MAASYAESLKRCKYKGKLGMPELFDTRDEIDRKCKQAAKIWNDLWNEDKIVVVITGAGISTSAGIPDFRGPRGVWTMERLDQKPPSIDFEEAMPTPTHMALVELERHHYINCLISQNVDGLHMRSGFPMNRLAEVHGNYFVEQCDTCGKKYYRSAPIAAIGKKKTGRLCEGNIRGYWKIWYPCAGKLKATVLDWHDTLPEGERTMAMKYIQNADLVVVLGSSLQITPVGNYPLVASARKAKLITVNLQKTEVENLADIAIHARVDDVMQKIFHHLELKIPEIYEPHEPVLNSFYPLENLPDVDEELFNKYNDQDPGDDDEDDDEYEQKHDSWHEVIYID